MKGLSSNSFSPQSPSFISHMVQMKAGHWKLDKTSGTFISHMVQMKEPLQ